MSSAPPPPPLPVTVGKGRIRISPTAPGYLFLAVVAAIWVGSLNYNSNPGFLLTFLLIGMTAVSAVHTYLNLRGICVLSVSAKPVFAGETARFQIRVESGALFRRRIEFRLQDQEKTITDFEGETAKEICIPATASRRGIFRCEPLRVSTQFPLGLFRCTADLPMDIHCLVFPKPISGRMQSGAAAPDSGGSRSSNSPGIDDFHELRPYRPGDALQHIYWKAYSGNRGLHVKSFSRAADEAILLDFNEIRGTDDEFRLSRLCDMVLETDRRSVSYGLRLPGGVIAPARGDSHRHACLKALALYGSNA
jgi:uncharacterized protein (DUF58 family)